jgi:mRNA interferase HigB
LEAFCELHPDARKPLRAWVKIAERAGWKSIVDVRRGYPHADAVRVGSGRTVTVFNISGNKYRLISALHYDRQKAYALMVLTHAEYDRNRWKEQL